MRALRAAALLLGLAGWPGVAAAATLTSSALGNIFVAGEPITMTLHADGDTAHWVLRDFFGKEAASGDAALSGGAGTFPIRTSAMGFFTLDVAAGRGPASTDKAQTTLSIINAAGPASGTSPFGVVTHFSKNWPVDIVPLIEKAGIARVRDEQPWGKIERQPGRYVYPPQFTQYMAALAAHHLDPLVEMDFANSLYDNGKTPFSDKGRDGYSAYTRAVVQQYGAQISAVEIWNEYNGSFCDGPCRSDRPGFYTSMLKNTYATLKAAHPGLTIAGGAAVNIPLDYFDALFQKGALDAMDAVVIHPYRKDPEGVEDKITQLRALMQHYGKIKPIWVTEYSDLQDMHKSRDDVARYLVKMSTLLLSAKVDRIYWYLMRDYQEFTGLGLVHSDTDPMGSYTPAPAYAAYATLIHELDGARFVRREPSDPQQRVYLFSQGGREIRVAWSDAPGGSYPLRTGKPVRLIDMMGNSRDVPVQKGTAAIALSSDPVYLIAGAP